MSAQRPGDTIPHQQETEGVIDKYLAESGSAAQVFEVADLVIPAGTDWSVAPHVFGTIEIPRAKVLVVAGYLELAENLPPNNIVRVVAPSLNPDPNVSVGVGSAGEVWAHGVDGAFSNGDMTPTDADDPWEARAMITTEGPLDNDLITPLEADVTVVLARVAFLLI